MEKQGGLGSFFPVDMGKATLCKVSWLLLSLKYASCAVSSLLSLEFYCEGSPMRGVTDVDLRRVIY